MKSKPKAFDYAGDLVNSLFMKCILTATWFQHLTEDGPGTDDRYRTLKNYKKNWTSLGIHKWQKEKKMKNWRKGTTPRVDLPISWYQNKSMVIYLRAISENQKKGKEICCMQFLDQSGIIYSLIFTNNVDLK